MKRQILFFELTGYILAAFLGAVLFFLYRWSGENVVTASFSIVTYSVFDHTKLLFWPAVTTTLLEYIIIGRKYHNFIYHKSIAFLVCLLFYLGSYYTYSGVIGTHFLFVDWFLYLMALCLFFRFSYQTNLHDCYSPNHDFIGWFLMYLLALLYIFFTFCPPGLSLFSPGKVIP